jgi:hypothetical protein
MSNMQVGTSVVATGAVVVQGKAKGHFGAQGTSQRFTRRFCGQSGEVKILPARTVERVVHNAI